METFKFIMEIVGNLFGFLVVMPFVSVKLIEMIMAILNGNNPEDILDK